MAQLDPGAVRLYRSPEAVRRTAAAVDAMRVLLHGDDSSESCDVLPAEGPQQPPLPEVHAAAGVQSLQGLQHAASAAERGNLVGPGATDGNAACNQPAGELQPGVAEPSHDWQTGGHAQQQVMPSPNVQQGQLLLTPSVRHFRPAAAVQRTQVASAALRAMIHGNDTSDDSRSPQQLSPASSSHVAAGGRERPSAVLASLAPQGLATPGGAVPMDDAEAHGPDGEAVASADAGSGAPPVSGAFRQVLGRQGSMSPGAQGLAGPTTAATDTLQEDVVWDPGSRQQQPETASGEDPVGSLHLDLSSEVSHGGMAAASSLLPGQHVPASSLLKPGISAPAISVHLAQRAASHTTGRPAASDSQQARADAAGLRSTTAQGEHVPDSEPQGDSCTAQGAAAEVSRSRQQEAGGEAAGSPKGPQQGTCVAQSAAEAGPLLGPAAQKFLAAALRRLASRTVPAPAGAGTPHEAQIPASSEPEKVADATAADPSAEGLHVLTFRQRPPTQVWHMSDSRRPTSFSTSGNGALACKQADHQWLSLVALETSLVCTGMGQSSLCILAREDVLFERFWSPVVCASKLAGLAVTHAALLQAEVDVSIAELGILPIVHTEPFYSNPRDVPEQAPVFASTIWHVPTSAVTNLPLFVQVTGCCVLVATNALHCRNG